MRARPGTVCPAGQGVTVLVVTGFKFQVSPAAATRTRSGTRAPGHTGFWCRLCLCFCHGCFQFMVDVRHDNGSARDALSDNKHHTFYHPDARHMGTSQTQSLYPSRCFKWGFMPCSVEKKTTVHTLVLMLLSSTDRRRIPNFDTTSTIVLFHVSR
jgi:hypothetical protein